MLTAARDLVVVVDGEAVLGFHDHPDEMWMSSAHADLARSMADLGLLRAERMRG